MRRFVFFASLLLILCLGEATAEVQWHDLPQALSSSNTVEGHREEGRLVERESRLVQNLGAARTAEEVAWDLGKTLAALVLVCGLLYVSLRFGLSRLVRGSGTGIERFRVIDKFGLEPKRVLYIVEVCGRRILLSSSEAGIRFLVTLDGAPFSKEEHRSRGAGAFRSFGDVLREKLDRPAMEPPAPGAGLSPAGAGQGEE